MIYCDLTTATQDFGEELLRGLSQVRKQTSPKLLYDRDGSLLFDRICTLPEYYPTRTEAGILEANKEELAEALGPGCMLFELGSGSSLKTRILLESLKPLNGYVPIDISRDHLLAAADRLREEFPTLRILPVCADFTLPFYLAPGIMGPPGRRVAFLPGSTLGNFDPPDAIRLFGLVSRWVGLGGRFLIGIDRLKDTFTLEAAYNDSQGVTAAFNLNLLHRANRELAADFNPLQFMHKAFLNHRKSRIEMHLVSLANQEVQVLGRSFSFFRGESIHTESSYKYRTGDFEELARRGGFIPIRCWTDPGSLFSVYLLESRPAVREAPAPVEEAEEFEALAA